MNSRIGIVAALCILGLWLFPTNLAAAGRGRSAGKAPSLLEAQYDRESNPKDRVKLAIQLTKVRLEQARTAYKAGKFAEGKEMIEKYLSAVERLERAVFEAADTGYSKRAEVHLRRQSRILESLQMSLSYMDRPAVEKAAARITALQEEVLYDVMNPREESAKK